MTKEKRFPDMWLDPEDDPREGGVSLGDERATLAEFLRGQRLTLELKCAGLNPEQLASRAVEPSTMSLLGLLRHMAEVERDWFRRVLAEQDTPRIYRSRQDPDADWNGAVADPAVIETAWRDWRTEVEFAERYLAEASTLDAIREIPHHGKISMREIVVHMIEEYARHNGHADLLRERIDGRTGQ